jgi:NADH-quinone oxidoreductase subunit H
MGALRAAYQLLAYEVPLVLSIAGVVMVAGSFDLIQIVESQSNLWFIGLLPIGFLVFFVSVMAELGRRPFDVPHAEQEIVYGWATEFTGVHYLLVMMAEYVHFCIGSVLITLLFLGGWHGAYLPPAAWFLIKFGIVTILIIMGRGVYPRFRIDQLLNVGWRILIPLALIQILIIFCLAKFAPWIIPAMR